ncbi:MAG: hypothetical protein RIQ64_414 [Actinomycetota bacterium]|jgi:predicted MFS family arabinose efflux permease
MRMFADLRLWVFAFDFFFLGTATMVSVGRLSQPREVIGTTGLCALSHEGKAASTR